MNIRNVKRILPTLLKHNICPFLWGSQGIGKTESVKQYCSENDLDLRILYTATQEVGDLIGLLVKDDTNGTAYHTRPEWFPTEGKGIIFLDELNRAPNDVLQALFSFIIKGELHRHKLPKGWKVVAAGNYQSDRFNVTDTRDAAWLSRFCHLDFTPSVEEWLLYAESRGADDIADFIRECPNMLELSAKDAGRLDMSFIVPDRRSMLEGIGMLEASGEVPEELKYEVYSGLVGLSAAAAYVAWSNKKEKSLTLKQILNSYTGNVKKRVLDASSSKKERRFDILNQPIDELLLKLADNPDLLSAEGYLSNIKLYLLDIPKELATKAFVRLSSLGRFYGKDALLNDAAYVELFNSQIKAPKK